MRLEGKVAIITGGAAGIGKATAEVFVREGAKVVICDVSEENGQAVAASIGSDVQFNNADICKRQKVQEWIEGVMTKYGRIDILVNNAGNALDALFINMKDGELVKQMSEAAFDSVKSKRHIQRYPDGSTIHGKRRGEVILNASGSSQKANLRLGCGSSSMMMGLLRLEYSAVVITSSGTYKIGEDINSTDQQSLGLVGKFEGRFVIENDTMKLALATPGEKAPEDAIKVICIKKV